MNVNVDAKSVGSSVPMNTESLIEHPVHKNSNTIVNSVIQQNDPMMPDGRRRRTVVKSSSQG